MARGTPGGLRTEIVASVALLTLVAILFVGTLMIQALEQGYIMEQVQAAQRAKNVLLAAIGSMIPGPGAVNAAEMRSRVKVLLADFMQGGMHIVWVDNQGRVLAGEAPVGMGEIWSDDDLKGCLKAEQEVSKVIGRGGWWPLWGDRRLVVAAPVYTPRGKLYGAIRMETPLGGLWGSLFRAGWVLAVYILLATGVLVLLGSYLIYRNVLNPLKRLIQASERIAQGDYDLPWEGFPPHEMGRLAEALASMAGRLQAHQLALKRQLEELERSNRALVQAYQAMIRSEKLASVGRLAAGVAHEIGNPIGSILGYAEILLPTAMDPAARDCLGRIRDEAERVQRTLRSLLGLARPAVSRMEWVDVESVVEETLAMMAGHKGMKAVELIRNTQGGLRPVWADRDHVRQVLVNLLLNALDALDGGGRLTINTGAVVHLPDDEAFVPPPRRRGEPDDADFSSLRRASPHALLSSSPGPYVYVQVEDTGTGISPENFQNLFEPFYTTKEPGKGTGLGLAVCLGIVESYGGRIDVKSRPGRGSRFTVYLPVEGPGQSGASSLQDRPGLRAPQAGGTMPRIGPEESE